MMDFPFPLLDSRSLGQLLLFLHYMLLMEGVHVVTEAVAASQDGTTVLTRCWVVKILHVQVNPALAIL